MPKASIDASPAQWIEPEATAFVAQTPWLENASIKDNILFGLPLRKGRYYSVLSASALSSDLAVLPDGDMTEIGARGINLSGGQQWRVSLARAFYSRAGILVLDDVFSAVDADVGRHIFEKGLMGDICRGRTIILATHHTDLCLLKAEYVVTLRNGIVTGHKTDRQMNVDPAALTQFTGVPKHVKFQEPVIERPDSETQSNRSSLLQNPDSQNKEQEVTRIRNIYETELIGHVSKAPIAKKKFVEDEFRDQGHVKWSIYRTYLQASGSFLLWVPAVVSIAASQLAILARGWWMKVWTEATAAYIYTDSSPLTYYLSVYVLISFAAALLEIIKCALVYTGGIRASRTLFSDLLYKVLHAPTRWLDTMPQGRILNRFTADFNSVDSKVPAENHALLSAAMSLICVFLAGLSLSPFMAIPYLVLLVLSIYYTFYYARAAREIRRLDATARSPILDLIGNAIIGLDTIRAYGKADDYANRLFARIDDWSKSGWAFWLMTQWMSLRMGLMGTLFCFSVAITIVMAGDVDASLAGFVLIFALNYSKALEDTIKRSTNFQFNMNSIERIDEFTKMAIEPQDGKDVPASWPSEGRIEINNLEIGYAADLPPVLHDLSLSIKPRERIGIVGRTGAGKSSLTLALFRCLEARSGTITIDNIDISKTKLHDLRSRMTLIPQDPVLFSGNVRSNLDPSDRYTDEELYTSLRQVHLLDSTPTAIYPNDPQHLSSHPFPSLPFPISPAGQNLSQGQRQLLCLARASLTKSKIVLMDEATSSVDMATDVLIQRSVRELFAESTLIVIAHRLQTVADFDRIIVLGEGKLLEEGSPKELMQRRGAWWRMVRMGDDGSDGGGQGHGVLT